MINILCLLFLDLDGGIGIVEMLLRPTFPDGQLWFFSVFMDLCNDLNYIIIFVVGFGITAADEHGMKEIIKRGRWFNLIIGNSFQHRN